MTATVAAPPVGFSHHPRPAAKGWGKRLILSLLVGGALVAPVSAAGAEQLLSHAEERRMVLGFQIDEQALAKTTPQGWRIDPTVDGPQETANLFLVLTEQKFVRDARGRTVEDALAMVWAAPARSSDGKIGFLILGGYSPPGGNGGPYGVYQPAELGLQKANASGAGSAPIVEEWTARDDQGGALRIRISYMPHKARSAKTSTRTFSARDPGIERLHRYDESRATLMDVGKKIDHLESVEVEVEGGPLETLIPDGKELRIVTLIPMTKIDTFGP